MVTDDQLKENSKYEYGYVENYEIVDRGIKTQLNLERMLDELGWEFAWETFRRRDLIPLVFLQPKVGYLINLKVIIGVFSYS